MQTPSREQIEAAHQLAEAMLRFLTVLRPSAPKPPEVRPPQRVEPKPAEDTPFEKLLVSAREAASLLCVSDRTLWTLTAPRGPIPSVRLGRSVRYSVEALRAWVRHAEA